MRYLLPTCLILFLTGCGQKGPLYLPDPAPAQPQTTSTTPPPQGS